MLGGVDARKNLVNNAERVVGTPVVEDCDKICLFKDVDEKNYWCFDFSTPHIKLGWQWDQTNNTDDDATPLRHMRLDITTYLQLYFKVVSDFQIEHFYKNEFTLDIPSFKMYVFTGAIFTEAGKYCPGFGWNIDAIDIKIKMIHNMVNCSKTLLKNLWNVEGVWTGNSAKLLEGCEWSQNDSQDDPEVELDFTTWELYEKHTDQLWLGTVDPESATYCKNIFGRELAYGGNPYDANHFVRSSNAGVLEEAYINTFNWIAQNYMPQTENEEGLKAVTVNRDFSILG